MAEIDIPIPLSQFRHINVGKHSLEKVIRKRSTGRSIHPEIPTSIFAVGLVPLCLCHSTAQRFK